MDDLLRLQARIASLSELRDLFGAMRGLAAAHVQEAQGALDGIRRYTKVVEDSIARTTPMIGSPKSRSTLWSAATSSRSLIEPPFAQLSPSNALIVVCSEHGFTGAFNRLLLERALADKVADQRLCIVGRRGAVLADELNIKTSWSTPMATRVCGAITAARQVCAKVSGASGARIVYARYRKGARFAVTAKQIVPVPDRLFEMKRDDAPPLHHLDPDVLLSKLVSEYLFSEITVAMMESLASENAARLQIMQAADHNISDKLENFTRDERALRQEAITSELLDVVTGSQSILG